MADFGHENNATNAIVADSGMIVLTDELLPCWKPKKNGSLNVNLK